MLANYNTLRRRMINTRDVLLTNPSPEIAKVERGMNTMNGGNDSTEV